MRASVRSGRLLAAVAVAAVGWLAAWGGAGAQTGLIQLNISCDGDPEAATVSNFTDTTLEFSTFSLTSIDQPRENEPFALFGTVPPGQGVTFQTGTMATENVLTNQFIFDNDVDTEGAILTTPYGTLTVLCSATEGQLTVFQPVPTSTPAPAVPTNTPVPPLPTNTPVPGVPTATAPVVVPTATTAPPAPPAPTQPPTTGGTTTLPSTGAGGGADGSPWLLLVVALGSGLAAGAAVALRTRRA